MEALVHDQECELESFVRTRYFHGQHRSRATQSTTVCAEIALAPHSGVSCSRFGSQSRGARSGRAVPTGAPRSCVQRNAWRPGRLDV